jgi:uncharacterized protein YceH (UPF0502 family)
VAEPAVELELTISQARVLGALMEKEMATPDAYPMTLNSLAAACSQTSNREPVIKLERSTVEMAALTLKSKGLLRVVYPGSGERATKYRHVADEALNLDDAEKALVCLLLVRGAQTAAELKARAERLHQFRDSRSVEAVLEALALREVPLVARVDRRPGQKETRWIQLLEVGAPVRAAAVSPATVTATARHGGGDESHVAALEARVGALEALVEALIDALGLVEPDGLRARVADQSDWSGASGDGGGRH